MKNRENKLFKRDKMKLLRGSIEDNAFKRRSAVSVALDNLSEYRKYSTGLQKLHKCDIVNNIKIILERNPKIDMETYSSILRGIVIFPEITYLTMKLLRPEVE